MCSEGACRCLKVLAVYRPLLLLPHQLAKPSVGAGVEWQGLTTYQSVRSAVLVYEKALCILKGVAYEPVCLVAPVLPILRAVAVRGFLLEPKPMQHIVGDFATPHE